MIVVSPEMFETMTKRAYKIAELHFQQVTFDWPAENAALMHDDLIERYVDLIFERWGKAANEMLDEAEASEVSAEK